MDTALPITTQSATDPSYRSLEAAANWYATLRGEDATPADRQAWQAWLGESEEHARAWATIESVSRRFDPLRASGHEAAAAGIKAALRGGVGRRRVLAGLAGFVGFAMAGCMAWRHTALPELVMAWGAGFRTSTGEQREITLADGTEVWLNTNSALSVDYEADARFLRLTAGEVLIQTASDTRGRPFYVGTRYGRMQALGTRFSVNHDDSRTRLDVFEGAVEIRNTAGALQRVEAGQRAEFTADGISAVAPAERAREAWCRGVVVADGIPLRQLIVELSRYQRGYIGVAPGVAELSVMGVYPAIDTERALTMLESALPVRINRILPWWVTIEPR
jgi:transmembrane sensor